MAISARRGVDENRVVGCVHLCRRGCFGIEVVSVVPHVGGLSPCVAVVINVFGSDPTQLLAVLGIKKLTPLQIQLC